MNLRYQDIFVTEEIKKRKEEKKNIEPKPIKSIEYQIKAIT